MPANRPKSLYGWRWQKARKRFLAAHPLCATCRSRGVLTAATVVDHTIPHRGDLALFWNEANWQPLCKTHHDAKTASRDRPTVAFRMRGAAADGSPLSPKHPWNDGGSLIPRWLPKPAIPVHMVCGPPGVGKSTFLASLAAAADHVLDLDVIRAELSGQPIYHGGVQWLDAALRERNARLAALANAASGQAWLIISCPNAAERQEWRMLLGPGTTYVLIAPERTCVKRCLNDRRRPYQPGRWERAVQSWFRQYQTAAGDQLIDASEQKPQQSHAKTVQPPPFAFA